MSNAKKVFSIPQKIHGGDSPILISWQPKQGTYLAVIGSNRTLFIYDRHGNAIERLPLLDNITGLSWDKDGDLLAAICEKSPIIILWDSNRRKLTQIDSSFKDPLSFLTWSRVLCILAVGTTKGNLLVYNHISSKKMPILGKHTRRITTGCWSKDGLLALGGDDRTLTLSNDLGDTVRSTTLRHVPTQIMFSDRKQDVRSQLIEGTISLVLEKKNIFLYSIDEPDKPIELAFQPKYGDIVNYQWYGDGYIMIGFSHGWLIIISTHTKEIGTELFQIRAHKNYLADIAISKSLYKAASCGDNCIKTYELQDIKDVDSIINLEDSTQSLSQLEWSEDGQLLALTTTNGSLHVYLTKLPLLASVHSHRIAFMTSLKEISIYDHLSKTKTDPLNLSIHIEPTFVALTQNYLAVGFNNRAWFYSLQNESNHEKNSENMKILKIGEKEYLNSVVGMQLNGDYAAAYMGNQLQLHTLVETTAEHRESILFPLPENNDGRISSFALVKNHLVYSTDTGNICHFYIDEWQFVTKYKHDIGVKKIYPENYGMSLIFVDEKSEAFIYNPINSTVIKIADFPSTISGIVWETFEPEKSIFIAYTGESIYTYVYSKYTVNGASCQQIGNVRQPYSSLPLILSKGVLIFLDSSGKIVQMKLDTHTHDSTLEGLEQLELIEKMKKNYKLKRFDEAFIYATRISDRNELMEFGKHALSSLEIDYAVRIYRLCTAPDMVFALNSIKHIEEKNLLCGHILVLLNKFDDAQVMFLASSCPLEALNMRRDLMHWDSAMKLAKGLASDEIPYISLEYGKQLEFIGDYPTALKMFEKGLIQANGNDEHNEGCHSGIARCSLKIGDIRRGVDLALKLPNKQVKRECGTILEGIRQYMEAGNLYEKGESWDKAALVYIKCKNWGKVGELLGLISNPKIHSQYAKAKEADGYFKEAFKSYMNAKEYENAIRIQLDHLKNPEMAVRIVKEAQSIEGAKMVASFFQKLGDYGSAVQFLVMSKCNDEAFHLARMHGLMELYGDSLGKEANPEDYESLALHFENENNNYLAGKFYLLAGAYPEALKHLIKKQPNQEIEAKAIDLAVECIGKANNEALTNVLIQYLMGDHDGMPKDAKYLFKLYLSLKKYVEAAKTAVLISRQEQQSGNYRDAHDVLFTMYFDLVKEGIKIPNELTQNLMILHTYILVKIQIKMGNHLKAARLLCRVAENISKFPSHIVQILTSTVIECQRSGLHNSAFNYASILLRPEYRDSIDPKHKKKIEALVRHPEKSEIEEETTTCPNCNFKLLEYGLTCPGCHINIPYCLITGAHMTKDDFSACPKCDFPATYSEFMKYLESEISCPMCSSNISRNDVKKIVDIEKYLKLNEEKPT